MIIWVYFMLWAINKVSNINSWLITVVKFTPYLLRLFIYEVYGHVKQILNTTESVQMTLLSEFLR